MNTLSLSKRTSRARIRKQLTAIAILTTALQISAHATEFTVSGANPASILGGINFGPDEAAHFDSNDLSTSESILEIPVNLRAIHIRQNGNFLCLTNTGGSFGGLTFDDQQVVKYNPITGIASVFFDFATVATSTSDLDIDAVSEFGGNLIISNQANITFGQQTFSDKDIIAFDLNNNSASLFFDGDLITDGDQFNNVSGVHVFADGTIGMSVSTGGGNDITLGGLQFTRNDAVLYDPNTGIATQLFEGDDVFFAPGTIVDALHVGPVTSAVPLPAAGWLLLAAAGYLSTRSRNGTLRH